MKELEKIIMKIKILIFIFYFLLLLPSKVLANNQPIANEEIFKAEVIEILEEKNLRVMTAQFQFNKK